MRVLLIAACALLAPRAQEEKEFHGVVVDSDGKPVADVMLYAQARV